MLLWTLSIIYWFTETTLFFRQILHRCDRSICLKHIWQKFLRALYHNAYVIYALHAHCTVYIMEDTQSWFTCGWNPIKVYSQNKTSKTTQIIKSQIKLRSQTQSVYTNLMFSIHSLLCNFCNVFLMMQNSHQPTCCKWNIWN